MMCLRTFIMCWCLAKSIWMKIIPTVTIVLNFSEGKLELRAASSDIGEGSAELPVEFTGEPLTASFNPAFLADPMRFADCETMTIKINDGITPVAIDGGDGFVYVLMPMHH